MIPVVKQPGQSLKVAPRPIGPKCETTTTGGCEADDTSTIYANVGSELWPVKMWCRKCHHPITDFK